MLVPVTLKHIQNGIEWDCFACPVALAIVDALFEATGRTYNVSVHYNGGTIVTRSARSTQIDLPTEVVQFMKDFDNPDRHHRVSPIEFTLDLDPKTLPLPYNVRD